MTSAVGKAFFVALSALYPILIFCGLFVWDFSPRKMSLLPFFLAAIYAISVGRGKRDAKTLFLVFVLALCGGLSFLLDNPTFFEFYPVFVNAGFFCLFAASLVNGNNFAFRLATLADKRILKAADSLYVKAYCRKVTGIWCGFFVLNGSISLWTILWGSPQAWSLYNGCIAYVLMGILFASEFCVRRWIQGKWHVYSPFSELRSDSRPDDSVVCFGGAGVFDSPKTWGDFKSDVSTLRGTIEKENFSAWIVSVDDIYHFLVSVFALFQSRKKILFTANRSPEYIREIRSADMGFLNDTGSAGSLQVPEVLKSSSPKKPWEPFDISSVQAAFFTSGTTGKPKAILKSGKQLENEVAALAKRFESNFVNRAVYTTVNHHHIFGLAFGVLLPISAGLPIRRRRFEFPEELKSLRRESPVIVSSPAFLKRLVSGERTLFKFRSRPFWLSAGGVLPDNVAHGVKEISRSGVQEIYGCTEAGAIATRNIETSALWQPIPPNEVSLAEDGRLKIVSSYADGGCFVSGDLGKVDGDGRFVLLGRADSIVKIEEKRISLPEVENRLRETGLVRDVRVVPMKGRREYLAAVIVLNEEGKSKFDGVSKKDINGFFEECLAEFLERTVLPKKWRYLEELPQDSMGKVKTRDVAALFRIPESPNFKILRYSPDGNAFSVKFQIPESSDYFDGHFPEFKLLPAVVQIDLVLRFFRAFLNLPTELERLPRVKFSSPIFPNMPVTVRETYSPDSGKIAFRMEADAGRVCSSGSIVLKRISHGD